MRTRGEKGGVSDRLSPADRAWLDEFLTSTKATEDPSLLSIVMEYLEEMGIEEMRRWEGLVRSSAEYLHSLMSFDFQTR